MEKIEVRSEKDDVKLSLIMGKWFDKYGDDDKASIEFAFKNYANILSQMASDEAMFKSISILFAKATLDVITIAYKDLTK